VNNCKVAISLSKKSNFGNPTDRLRMGILFTFAILVASRAIASSEAYECLDLVMNKCPIASLDKVADFPRIEDFESCTKLCDEGQEASCNSYVHNNDTKICTIYRSYYQDFVKDCKFFGAGEDTPSHCLLDDNKYTDLCKYIIESGDCTFNGKLLLTVGHVYDPEECFVFTSVYNASYYTHDKETHNCTVYESNTRTCNERWALRKKTRGCPEEA